MVQRRKRDKSTLPRTPSSSFWIEVAVSLLFWGEEALGWKKCLAILKGPSFLVLPGHGYVHQELRACKKLPKSHFFRVAEHKERDSPFLHSLGVRRILFLGH